MQSKDVIIIGAGSAGLSARSEVAKKTSNYVVIDPGPLGTTCARVGCMPSKVLIEVANAYYKKHRYSQMGIRGQESLKVHIPDVLKHVRSLRDRFVRGVLASMESWRETHLIQGYARFVDPHTLEVNGERIQKHIIVATGSRPIFSEAWAI